MTGSDDFLSRWSRRKRDASKGVVSEDEHKDARLREDAELDQEPRQDTGEAPTPANKLGTSEGGKAASEEPAFDLSKLPSLDSITAETDIRPFLAAGVPATLRQAALRRAWSADPKIRDFIGIAENQWDFTGNSEVLGFDFAPPSGDVKRMVAELFGERDAEAESGRAARGEESLPSGEQPQPNESAQRTGGSDHVAVTEDRAVASHETEFAAMNKAAPEEAASPDSAAQNNDATQQEKLVVRRSHGSAMPR